MIEIPEALTLANQINSSIMGKKIINVIAEQSPHKFAWYNGDPQGYGEILMGRTVDGATAFGGMVSIKAGSATMLFGDGVGIRYSKQGEKAPAKHQLLVEFEDTSMVTASIQMYGGIWCFDDKHKFENSYYEIAKAKPSPLSNDFNENYFDSLISSQDKKKLSLKAFLATEQRIPGLGNGVLQDILWRAKLHPKCKISMLKDKDKDNLYRSIKAVLFEMSELLGRDTEKDFFGNKGGYRTMMSKNNVDSICPICGGIVKKENYLGGSIYYCEGCQTA